MKNNTFVSKEVGSYISKGVPEDIAKSISKGTRILYVDNISKFMSYADKSSDPLGMKVKIFEAFDFFGMADMGELISSAMLDLGYNTQSKLAAYLGVPDAVLSNLKQKNFSELKPEYLLLFYDYFCFDIEPADSNIEVPINFDVDVLFNRLLDCNEVSVFNLYRLLQNYYLNILEDSI